MKENVIEHSRQMQSIHWAALKIFEISDHDLKIQKIVFLQPYLASWVSAQSRCSVGFNYD